tara:strand:- start:1527 stop:2501 length:975 start_codon:yes stop_codon:yes gene_type:complete
VPLLLLIYCLLFNCGLENKKIEIEHKNDLQKHNLQDKVKYVATSRYEAVESFGMIQKGDKMSVLDNEIFTKDTIRYNPKGYIQEDVIILHPGVLSTESGVLSTEYKYDEQGLLKETIGIRTSWPNKQEPAGNKFYKYNNKKQLIELIDSSIYSFLGIIDTSIFITSYEYNELGQILSKFALGNFGVYEEWEYKYDNQGNKIEVIKYIDDVITARSKFTYDINNNIINEITYEKSGETNIKKHEYDNQGNITKQSTILKINPDDFNWTNENGVEVDIELNEKEYDVTIEITYKYEYDKKMNWTSRVKYMGDMPLVITERKIKYYK